MSDLRESQEAKEPFSPIEAASFAFENGPVVSMYGYKCSGGFVMQLVTQRGKKLGPVILTPAQVQELTALLRKNNFLP